MEPTILQPGDPGFDPFPGPRRITILREGRSKAALIAHLGTDHGVDLADVAADMNFHAVWSAHQRAHAAWRNDSLGGDAEGRHRHLASCPACTRYSNYHSCKLHGTGVYILDPGEAKPARPVEADWLKRGRR